MPAHHLNSNGFKWEANFFCVILSFKEARTPRYRFMKNLTHQSDSAVFRWGTKQTSIWFYTLLTFQFELFIYFISISNLLCNEKKLIIFSVVIIIKVLRRTKSLQIEKKISFELTGRWSEINLFRLLLTNRFNICEDFTSNERERASNYKVDRDEKGSWSGEVWNIISSRGCAFFSFKRFLRNSE